MNKPMILVVEDDKPIRKLITTTLETQGYKYHTAETGRLLSWRRYPVSRI